MKNILIKTLPQFNIKIFYDERKFENPLKIKFPNICYSDDYEKKGDFLWDMEEMEDTIFPNTYLCNNYNKVSGLLSSRISVKYYKRMVTLYEYYFKFEIF